MLCTEYIYIAFFSNYYFINLLSSLLPLSTHILFGLQLDSSKIFWNAIVVVIHFLSSKSTNHLCFLKISITDKKNRITLLNLLINWIPVRLMPQILSIKSDCTFLFLNFPIIILRNSQLILCLRYSHFSYHY